MTINLSQPITFDQFRDVGRLLKSSRPLLISVLSALLIVFFSISCYAIYGNYEVYEQKNADLLEISNQMRLTEKRLSKLVTGEANYFNQLKAAPESNSELVDLLSNIATASNLIVKKLIANEGVQNREKDGLVEMELDGRFPSMNEFLLKIKPHLAASNVLLLKVEKKKDTQYVHLTMNVKFSKPPELKKNKPSVAFNFRGADFIYDTFANWHSSQVGFVQVPSGANVQKDKPPQEGAQRSTDSAEVVLDEKRPDPFLPSPKLNQLDGGRGSSGNEGAMFLSGILYAKHKSVCIVTFPSGESKVFESGDSLDARKRVTSIKPDAVTIRSSFDKEFKVGQEIHVK